MHHKQSRKAGKRHGTRHESRTSHKSRPPATSGHHHRPKERATTEAPAILKIQIYLKFCRFWSPIFPRKHQSTPKNLFTFAPFYPDDMQGIGWRVLDVCPNGLKFGSRRGWRQRTPGRGWRQAASLYIEHTKGTPPLFAERQVPFTPIIFRTIKIEKSSPKRT